MASVPSPSPVTDVRDSAPKIVSMEIPIDKIGEVIGPKGKVINTLQQETGADIAVDDDGMVGTVTIGAKDGNAVEEARRRISLILDPPTAEVGAIYPGKVVNITKFGAFVNVLPGRDGLLHISKLSSLADGKRINNVEDVLTLGQPIEECGWTTSTPRARMSLESLASVPGRSRPVAVIWSVASGGRDRDDRDRGSERVRDRDNGDRRREQAGTARAALAGDADESDPGGSEIAQDADSGSASKPPATLAVAAPVPSFEDAFEAWNWWPTSDNDLGPGDRRGREADLGGGNRPPRSRSRRR